MTVSRIFTKESLIERVILILKNANCLLRNAANLTLVQGYPLFFQSEQAKDDRMVSPSLSFSFLYFFFSYFFFSLSSLSPRTDADASCSLRFVCCWSVC